MIKGLNHIAIAVKSIEGIKESIKRIFNKEISEVHTIESDGIRAGFIEAGGIRIEFIEPISKNSKIERFLNTRGEGIHHICFEVDDIEGQIEELNSRGVKLIDEKPRAGAGGSRIAFIYPVNGILIELAERQ